MTFGQRPGADRQSSSQWTALRPGVGVSVVKLSPDGAEAARYAGEVVGSVDPGRWRIIRATWTYDPVETDGLAFQPDDRLLEWFSPDYPFNAFAVFSPVGVLRGWYANVTLPTFLADLSGDGAPTIVWHDLYLDLVGLPDGQYSIRDEDELEASALASRDSCRYQAIVAAARELERRFVQGEVPFIAAADLATFLQFPNEPENRG